VTDRPNPASLDLDELDRAEVELERQYGVPSFKVARGDEVDVPADVVAWWRAADARRRALIAAIPRSPVYLTDDIEPTGRRKDRMRKPGPTR
jgi:hypothetical protein